MGRPRKKDRTRAPWSELTGTQQVFLERLQALGESTAKEVHPDRKVWQSHCALLRTGHIKRGTVRKCSVSDCNAQTFVIATPRRGAR